MSAEDLDKLFRDKLKDKPVTPSNDVWERMQARMQQNSPQEVPNPFMVPVATEQKEERSTIRMWYYSAAAAVTMLLSVGLWVNRENIDPLQPSGTVATVQQPTSGSAPIGKPSKNSAEVTYGSSQEGQSTQGAQEKVSESLAGTPAVEQHPQILASVSPKASTQAEGLKQSSVKGKASEPRKSEVSKPMTPVQEPAMMAAVTPAKAQETSKATADAAPSLEIIVKLDNAQATSSLAQASTKETDSPQEVENPGTGRVLKGILKQVKNLKDGEKVNLSELGITKHTYALETRIGNKKITKTIEL